MNDYDFYLKVKDRYKVTKDGNVYSMYYANRNVEFKRGKPLLLKPFIINEYKRVQLNYKGLRKQISVHRLVAFEYIGKPPINKLFCGHKNDIKHDNRLENLYWIDAKQNAEDARRNVKLVCGERHGNSKLTIENIKYIFIEFKKGKLKKHIAKELNVSPSTVGLVLNGKLWKQAISDEALSQIQKMRGGPSGVLK